jgi:hypothetical protein
MDTRTGQIYDTRDAAEAAGVPAEHIVTGPRQALEELSRHVKRHNGVVDRRKRNATRKAARERQAASRKRNR